MTSIAQQLENLAKQLNKVLLADRVYGRREIRRIQKAMRKSGDSPKLHKRCQALAKRLDASRSARRARSGHRPHLEFDPDLPINAKRQELLDAIKNHQVLIVAGETGSGKTTQLPKLCMAAGRGIGGWIGVTQPRRIAATTVSRRIAEELGEKTGQTVGYKIRFQDSVSSRTRIKLMTDGILLAEAHHDAHLNHYDTLIVDEAHERSLNIDFILGILKKLLNKRRDLKVIITSATIDTEKFAGAFGGAPIIEVSGRMYPVETRYMADDDDEATHVELAVKAVDHLAGKRRNGDILVFMPTEQDIRDTCETLEGRRIPGARIIPLFARLSGAQQQNVFRAANGRKIIVATNVAETSITIPGIHFVIDTGLARISQYTPRSRTTTLPVSPISRSSADQRQGRCGRMANGICIRLYTQEDYDDRPLYTAPEILRANLAEVILRMIALRLGDVEDFPFIDPPAPKSIQDGYRLLQELGAIERAPSNRSGQGRYALTAKGRLMAQLPLDPRLSCMLLEARHRGCLDDMAIIAAALSIQDPRERPAIRQAEADQAQARFISTSSDFITLLNIWHTYREKVRRRKSWGQVKNFCYDHFLSFRRMREWQDIYRQIIRVLADHDIKPKRPSQPPEEGAGIENSWYGAVHQAILCGFLSNIALKKEGRIFQASHNRQVMIFPGSGLFKNPSQWIVAAEMVETSRLFARCVAMIDPGWIEPIGKAQCRYTYLDPHWERKRGQVVSTEQVSLYGLIIDRRPKPYGPINPEQASDIFIRRALIDADVVESLPFMAHNSQIITNIDDLENRLRRKDIRMDDEALVQFYGERLGHVYDMRTLKQFIKKRGGDRFLHLTEEDLLHHQPSEHELGKFPDRLSVGHHHIDVQYSYNPGKPGDGVTAIIPAAMAKSINAQAFQWMVPGLLEEKITALIKGLPKNFRKKLVPVSRTVDLIMAQMPRQAQSGLLTTLSRFIRKHFGVEIPAAAWDEQGLPDHLRMWFALTDESGKVIKRDRHAAILSMGDIGYRISSDFEMEKQKWERSPIETWDFGDLPESVTLNGDGGRRWTAYPALENRENTLVLTLFSDPGRAEAIHLRGVKSLLMRHFRKEIQFLRKNLKLPPFSDSAGRYFGGRKTLEEQLATRVIDDLLLKRIRSAEGYHALIQKLEREGIAHRGRTKLKRVADVLSSYAALRIKLHDTGRTHANKKKVQLYLDTLRENLNTLVPKSFVQLYDNERLERLVRYIQALAIRAERGLTNIEKDRIKSLEVELFARQLNEIIETLSPQTSQEKRLAVEAFYWMLEEFKISVFAQEIKTAHPVSAKRLKAQLR
ncbi:MAG: ATP-dependent RNA helicase HrpA, partial [Desulfobacteraceae bacterium]